MSFQRANSTTGWNSQVNGEHINQAIAFGLTFQSWSRRWRRARLVGRQPDESVLSNGSHTKLSRAAGQRAASGTRWSRAELRSSRPGNNNGRICMVARARLSFLLARTRPTRLDRCDSARQTCIRRAPSRVVGAEITWPARSEGRLDKINARSHGHNIFIASQVLVET